MSGGAPSFSGGTKPPRKTQPQWSQPLENDQRPLTRKPPSTRSMRPVGASEEEMRTLESLPHTSSCACSGKRASCQLCTPTTPSTQALDAQPVATVACTSKKVRGSTSRPPQRAGCNMRKKPAARKSAMVSSGTRRRRSASATRPARTGTSSRARARSGFSVATGYLLLTGVELAIPAPEPADRAVAVAQRWRVAVDLVLPDLEVVLEAALEVVHVAADGPLGRRAVADHLEGHGQAKVEVVLIDRRVGEQHVVLHRAIHAHDEVARPVVGGRRREDVHAAPLQGGPPLGVLGGHVAVDLEAEVGDLGGVDAREVGAVGEIVDDLARVRGQVVDVRRPGQPGVGAEVLDQRDVEG